MMPWRVLIIAAALLQIATSVGHPYPVVVDMPHTAKRARDFLARGHMPTLRALLEIDSQHDLRQAYNPGPNSLSPLGEGIRPYLIKPGGLPPLPAVQDLISSSPSDAEKLIKAQSAPIPMPTLVPEPEGRPDPSVVQEEPKAPKKPIIAPKKPSVRGKKGGRSGVPAKIAHLGWSSDPVAMSWLRSASRDLGQGREIEDSFDVGLTTVAPTSTSTSTSTSEGPLILRDWQIGEDLVGGEFDDVSRIVDADNLENTRANTHPDNTVVPSIGEMNVDVGTNPFEEVLKDIHRQTVYSAAVQEKKLDQLQDDRDEFDTGDTRDNTVKYNPFSL